MEKYSPNAVVFRDDNGLLWTSAHNIAKLIGKDNATIDNCVYKALHKERNARHKLNFEHTDVHINNEATQCVLLFCFAPTALQKAFAKLFAELAADKTIAFISVFFDENWEMHDKWASHIPMRPEPAERTLIDGVVNGYYQGTHGKTKAPTEPLDGQELAEWEELRLADMKSESTGKAKELFAKYRALLDEANSLIQSTKDATTGQTNAKAVQKEVSDILSEARKVALDQFVAETKYIYPADFHPGYAEKFQKMVQLYADWYDGKIGCKASVAEK